jgi:hypothetical protein
MNDFMKYFTIARLVEQIIGNFINAGGPAPNPQVVGEEVRKELVRKVASGHLPEEFLEDHENIIAAAIESHPGIPLPKAPVQA